MKKINLKELGVEVFDSCLYLARDCDGDVYGYQYLPEYDSRAGEWFPEAGKYAYIKRKDLTKIESLLGKGEIVKVEVENPSEECNEDLLYKAWGESFITINKLLNVKDSSKDSIYFLNKATETQSSRAGEYDTIGEKERNMQKIVDMFNACTGKTLTEAEGYLFMECLKNVRLFNAPDFHEDSAIDGVSYSSLKAEAKAREHGL